MRYLRTVHSRILIVIHPKTQPFSTKLSETNEAVTTTQTCRHLLTRTASHHCRFKKHHRTTRQLFINMMLQTQLLVSLNLRFHLVGSQSIRHSRTRQFTKPKRLTQPTSNIVRRLQIAIPTMDRLFTIQLMAILITVRHLMAIPTMVTQTMDIHHILDGLLRAISLTSRLLSFTSKPPRTQGMSFTHVKNVNLCFIRSPSMVLSSLK